jgi:phosphate-selective porin OprO/OprP
MKHLPTAVRAALASATLLAGLSTTALGADASADELAALREQLRALDQKIKVLERKQELADEADATAAKAAPKITVNDKGFSIASNDGANQLKLRGLVQADARVFSNQDPALTNNSTFLIRRARIIFEGTLAKNYSFLLVPDFAVNNTTTLQLVDAYVNTAITPSLNVRIGRFREPVGLEQLQSDSVAFFAERSLVSQLLPNRDLGIQVWGDVLGGRLSYAVGAFNGIADGANNNNNGENDQDKDIAARLFAQPWKNDGGSPLQGLGFGVGASFGRQKPVTANLTSGYRTDGQQTFFSYRAVSALAASKTNFSTVTDGTTWRISPQGYYYYGPFGLLGEYALSTVNVRPNFPASLAGSPKIELTNKAWQVAASYVLTGEDAAYTGVVPATNFDWAAGAWGAFEVVARYDVLDLDNKAFVTPGAGYSSLADPAANPTKISTLGLGLNWYLGKAVRVSFDWFHTQFDNNVAVPTRALLRADETAFVTRLQVAF